MFLNVAGRVGMELGPVRYQRHRPEQTALYHIIEQHYPTFTAYRKRSSIHPVDERSGVNIPG